MMIQSIIVAACALFAVCNAGVLPVAHHHTAAALVAPVAAAAIVAPYATSYNAHTVNHAVAQQVIGASAPLVHAASAYVAASPYQLAAAAPYVAASPYVASPHVASPYVAAAPYNHLYNHHASYVL